ncbi:poly(A)-specific ribonuclease PARN-like domain-containing protein 1 isoform X2 [Fopius arisanus]|uniref:Poly(A)-specific ribonuclease PARN-like domain-containing protein 1 isoform X2 n=1 Tax=Fopius arisanus TaxID=64838 RepID=A0A9R1TBX3_9HYME|nr:PREDICTED: poly(A)-specific ribonuclease PARN-like domain-containing protein 1 isoform X2 [Fopius arisanus]
MNEILDDNFMNSYPKIEYTLKNASFIAVDAEFSGIDSENVPELTLFDTVQERYEKQRNNIAPYTAIQIGLTAFTKVQQQNKYIAEPFRFYLLSRSLLHGSNQNFQWEKTSMNFLRRHNFDWNKLVNGGISYLNQSELSKMQSLLKVNDYMSNMGAFRTLEEENKFVKSIKNVTEWLKDSPLSEKSMEIECDDFVQLCCLQRQLRKSFKGVWTEQKGQTIFVIKVDAETRKILEEGNQNFFEEQLLEYILGFTRVFQLLCDLKKPIVGHNILLDLMFMYKQFYKDLPTSYQKFKREIHELMPTVYDTKFLSYEMRKILDSKGQEGQGNRKKGDKGRSNILEELYRFFKNGDGRLLTWNSPNIEFPDETTTDTEAYHDAGWDSYYTGYCFIKMAHVFCNPHKSCGTTRELSHVEMMSSLKSHVNCVNLIRADLSYLSLDGPDPPSRRPPRLNITALHLKSISTDEIMRALSSFDHCDVQVQSPRSVLVAAPNWRTAREIIQHFQKTKDYEAVPYNFLKHSPTVRSLLWGTLVVSGSMLAMLIHRAVQKPPVT